MSVGDSNGSNPWAAQFGWPVGPGTLVTVSVSNLDRLFQTIGEQLTEQRSMINALTQRVGDQDTLIQQLREQGDTFVSYRDAADARLDELKQQMEALQLPISPEQLDVPYEIERRH